VTVERWGDAGDPREVIFTTIHDLGHVWPGGHRLLPEKLVGPASARCSATRDLWAFFGRHTR
jgi:poly(3-hydroxybutyrate) depolymerase